MDEMRGRGIDIAIGSHRHRCKESVRFIFVIILVRRGNIMPTRRVQEALAVLTVFVMIHSYSDCSLLCKSV